ncbi:MAG: HD domain-containing protein [Flavobacteriales bacterium]|nr:HD domain-containing protein [Flavobacteriales bacterium]MCB9198028.1 HD domain-containing protein [Flavobacteriales bacterium]
MNPAILNIFKIVHQAAHNINQPAFVIGGFVRDLLLNRPCKDLDFVTKGSGIHLAEEVAKILKTNQITVFKNFGTAMIKHDDYELEFVGARKESYQRESRKPIVEDGTLEDDQKRRDFTINALAIDLFENDFNKIVDPFNGLKDLEDQIIRTPLDPDITFSDDPLRMLRAIRFACQLGFKIDDESYQALTRNAHRIDIISKERVIDEINKMILSPNPSLGFKLMFNTRLLHRIFPEMVALHGVEVRDGKGHKDNFYHTLEVLENISKNTDDLWLRWAAIMHDIAKPPTKRFHPKAGWTFHGHEDKGARMVPKIFKHLKLPLDAKMKYVQKLVALHLRPIALTKEEITDAALRRLIVDAGEDLEDLLTLCRADITSKNPEKVKKYLTRFDEVEQKLKDVEERDELRNWQPPITGEMIMKAFNLPPCKQVGEIKQEIREAILDGKVENDLDKAKAYMLELGKKMGL